MDAKQLEKELQHARDEIEEMAMQLADMLGAALYFAGVKQEDLPKAIDLYVNSLDEVFEDEDEESEMGFEEVIEVINFMKSKHPKLFQK